MPEIDLAVYLIVGVVIVNGLAGRIGMPAPILLVVVGFAVSFIPGVPDYQVDPEFVLAVLLPPLLYAAANEASVIAIRRLIRPILQLAVGMVLITALAVAGVLTLIVPDMPFAAALALGAIVAPPDAVAAVAVARRAGLPQHVVTVLDGESLFNDATSLVLLRVAIVGVSAGSMAWGPAIGEFAWATAGGLLVGVVVGALLTLAHRVISSTLAITALSLVTPFLAYELGERINASGVLAVVVAGLILGFRGSVDLDPEVRLTLRSTWAAVRYVLEGSVFALIGLQLWAIVTAPDVRLVDLVVVSLAVLATVILVRPLWIFLMHALLGRIGPPDSVLPDAKSLVAVSWAGMRGVVSLAAAQTLPLDTPYRPLLLTCTIAVIVGTLVVQGLTLPAVIKALHFPGDPRHDRIREKDAATHEANVAIAEQVERMIREESIPEMYAERMRAWVRLRDLSQLEDHHQVAGDALGDGTAADHLRFVARWRHELVNAEREVFLRLRGSGDLSEESLRDLEFRLDLEEALLDSRVDDATGHLEQLRVVRQDREDEPE